MLFVIAALVVVLTLAAQAGASGDGVPDGEDQPNVGMLAVGFEEDGELVRYGRCSGFYVGSPAGRPAEKQSPPFPSRESEFAYGDSGSPKLIHDTSTAVAITSGGHGDPNCRSNSDNVRLDTDPAREFYGRYLTLP